MIGTIKCWVALRGFGFITAPGLGDVFLHRTALRRRTGDLALPEPGDVVEFTVIEEARGPRARDAVILKRAAETAQR
jgi:cold shock CspA family protein